MSLATAQCAFNNSSDFHGMLDQAFSEEKYLCVLLSSVRLEKSVPVSFHEDYCAPKMAKNIFVRWKLGNDCVQEAHIPIFSVLSPKLAHVFVMISIPQDC